MEIEETKGIRAVMILEIIGKPPEHLLKTLESLIKNMDNEKGVVVKEKSIKDPILMKNEKDFYTTHAEIEVEVEEIMQLVGLMFKYMPANVEIINPELIVLTNNGWSEILTEITRRIHGYDEITRIMQLEKTIMEKKLKEVLGDKENKDKEKKK